MQPSPLFQVLGRGEPMAQAALVVLTRSEHCRCLALYSQPASPGSTEREKLAFFFFSLSRG